jgi:hypothetical protein
LIYKEIARWAVRRALVGACEERIFRLRMIGRMECSRGAVVELDTAVIKEVASVPPSARADGVGELALLTDQTKL